MKKWLKDHQSKQFSWYSATGENQQKVDLEKNKITKLSLIDLQSIFVLSVFGVCGSIFVFFLEFLRASLTFLRLFNKSIISQLTY